MSEATGDALSRFAVNLASQMALHDGGSFVTVRAIAARIVDETSIDQRDEVERMMLGVIELSVRQLVARGAKLG